jgi:hypothetical protein
VSVSVHSGRYRVEQKVHYRPDAKGKFPLNGYVNIYDSVGGVSMTVAEELLPSLIAALQAFVTCVVAEQGKLIGPDERMLKTEW